VAAPTLITCFVDSDWVQNRTLSAFAVRLYISDSNAESAYLWGDLIPKISVVSTSLEEVGPSTVHVRIVYACGVDLSQYPLAVRLIGTDADITDVVMSEQVIKFTARRITGPLTATVELYDSAVEADPAKAEALVKLDASVIIFHADSRRPAWAYVLISIGLLVLLTVCVLLLRRHFYRHDKDDEDDEYECEDEPTPPSRATQYSAIN
jgi:hypothetical protein